MGDKSSTPLVEGPDSLHKIRSTSKVRESRLPLILRLTSLLEALPLWTLEDGFKTLLNIRVCIHSCAGSEVMTVIIFGAIEFE